MSRVDDYFLTLEKAELHLHLEGSIEPETLLELSPDSSIDELRARYDYTDFPGFLQAYKWVTGLIRTPQDYALITRRLLESLAAQNVRYLELNLSAGVILWRSQSLPHIYEAVRSAAAESAIEVNWIFDAVRQLGHDAAMRVAEFAAERVRDGVVGFGVGGDETRVHAQEFANVFTFAKRAGLHLAPHAGETSDAQNVWDVVNLGAERIGHGIRAIEDPVLLRHLRDHDIPLEISITSNLATGAVASLDAHPVRRLFDAGVPIVLNSDDPAMFHTTLTNEYRLAASHFGFSNPEIEGLARNGFRYRFHKP
jgi:aminodeoxyfutalosine deaminase